MDRMATLEVGICKVGEETDTVRTDMVDTTSTSCSTSRAHPVSALSKIKVPLTVQEGMGLKVPSHS